MDQVFEVDPSKGHIRLKSSIKTKENQVYQFFVRASDRSSTNPLHSDVPVEVYIMSSLDFPPMFDRRDSQFYVSENSPLGRLVVQLHARVPPSGDEIESSEVENEIKYSIVSTEYMAVDGDDSEETLFQVWSLTQFYSVDFSKSRIGVKKCNFNKRTIKVCVRCC